MRMLVFLVCLRYIESKYLTDGNLLRSDSFKEQLVVLQRVGNQLAALPSDDTHEMLFGKFVSLFQRQYVDDERNIRKKVFKESLKRHVALNEEERRMNGTAVYGINQFTDWTTEEFKKLLTVNKPSANDTQRSRLKRSPVDHIRCALYPLKYPDKMDWSKMTTSVKDQKSCGSCWAFVASEQVESYSAINGAPMVELSPQELLSCSPSLGCDGGNTCEALTWLMLTGDGLMTEKDYPYVEAKEKCLYNNRSWTSPTVKAVCGCRSLVGHEEIMLYSMAQKGPLAVNVDAVSWHDYISGIIQHHCSNASMNHAVQLIGYKLNDGPVPYWVARNQWGPSFGENGYLRIRYGDNVCGVAEEPSFVVV